MEHQKEDSAPSRFLRRDDVSALVGLSPTEIYRQIKDDRFPKPLTLGARCVRWDERDVLDWMENKRAVGRA